VLLFRETLQVLFTIPAPFPCPYQVLFPKSIPVIPSSISFSFRVIFSTSFVLRLPRLLNRHHLIKTSIPNDFPQTYDHALERLRGTPSSNVTVLKPPPPLSPETSSSVTRPANPPVVPSLRSCNKSSKVPFTGNIMPGRIVPEVSISLELGVEYIRSFGNKDSLRGWLDISVRFSCGC
jgi:hypothetical protein